MMTGSDFDVYDDGLLLLLVESRVGVVLMN